MEYVNLGSSGLRISRLGLGAMGFGDPKWRSWVLSATAAQPVFERALEQGINFFDTCNFYSGGESERILGRFVRDACVDREALVIATKFGMPMADHANAKGYSRKNIFAAVDGSLSRLGLDYIDVYQTHIWDPGANVEEMMGALGDLVGIGKVLYIGATDMPAWQFAKANYIADREGWPRFASTQNHYNLVWREDEAELIPYCPMARGLLCGMQRLEDGGTTERLRTDQYINLWYGRDTDRAIGARVDDVAAKHGVKPAQVALAWVLGRAPGVAPIFGARNVEQVDDAIAALDLRLDDADEDALTAGYAPRLRT